MPHGSAVDVVDGARATNRRKAIAATNHIHRNASQNVRFASSTAPSRHRMKEHRGWRLPAGQAELFESPWLAPLGEQLMQRGNKRAPLNVQLPYLGEVGRLVLVS